MIMGWEYICTKTRAEIMDMKFNFHHFSSIIVWADPEGQGTPQHVISSLMATVDVPIY